MQLPVVAIEGIRFPLELEFQGGCGVVSCLTPVLGTKLGAVEEKYSVLAAESPLQL